MKDLFEKTNFLLDGGVLVLLSEYLADRISRGLIARPDGNDLAVLDAFGTPMNSLFLEGAAGAVDSAFPSPPLRTSFDVLTAPLSGEWPWAVRLRGMGWRFYILLGEEPTAEILEEMTSFAGLINLWQLHQKTAGVEERLSRLAYMVLATKNTLASLFEHMGVNYLGAFLHDVVNESLFPPVFPCCSTTAKPCRSSKGRRCSCHRGREFSPGTFFRRSLCGWKNHKGRSMGTAFSTPLPMTGPPFSPYPEGRSAFSAS